MAQVEVEVANQNVVERVTSLPLVSSTYGMVSTVYCNTKDTHPYIKSVCEVAEQSVRTMTSVALTSAMPIISKLEPQIAIANDLACKGLDQIEKSLPILHQPSDQIVASVKSVVSGAHNAVTGKVNGAKDTVTGAKDTVSDTLSSVVHMTRGMVEDGVEMTRAVVSGGVNTVLETRVARLVSSGVDTALGTSESLVDQYLPLTEDELETEAKMVKGFVQEQPSYYVRLGSLSTKLRKRAYAKALAQVQDAKQRSHESITSLNKTVDLIGYARNNVDGAHKMYDNLMKSSGPAQENGHEAELIESRTLALARTLTQQLQTTCLVLVSGVKGLPNNIQQEALSLSHSAAQVYSHFSQAVAFRDLPDSVLASSKAKLIQMKESMDSVMDYLVNNTPLNWLVGPFYPRLPPPGQAPDPAEASTSPATASTASTSPLSPPHQEAPMEVEMESLGSDKLY